MGLLWKYPDHLAGRGISHISRLGFTHLVKDPITIWAEKPNKKDQSTISLVFRMIFMIVKEWNDGFYWIFPFMVLISPLPH